MVAQLVKLPPIMVVSHMGASSCPAAARSILRAAEAGLGVWVPALIRKNQKKLLAPGFTQAQAWPAQTTGR